MGWRPVVAKTMIHSWEEPPISGSRGSGAVFFAGCGLGCAYCQNYEISQWTRGARPYGLNSEVNQSSVGARMARLNTDRPLTAGDLVAIFFRLADQHVHNINLVTAAHFVPAVAEAIEAAKKRGFPLPFVYNSSGYEKVETLRRLDGLIDIYLPDIKYCNSEPARRYSHAPDYFAVASAAVLEMRRQVGDLICDGEGIGQKGLIIRHLVLPGQRKDSMAILDWIAANLPRTAVSLLAQYTPVHRAAEFPEINRRVTTFEYQSVVDHFWEAGLTNGYTQDRRAAVREYIPDWS